jgi:hypothetical protein
MTSESEEPQERQNHAKRRWYALYLAKTTRSHRYLPLPLLNLLSPQIHHLLPPAISLWIRKGLPQMLNTRIELLRALLAIKVKRNITHACSSHAQQSNGHGQIDPGLTRGGEDAALFAAGLEHGGVFGAGEDENGLERLDGEEGAEDGRG